MYKLHTKRNYRKEAFNFKKFLFKFVNFFQNKSLPKLEKDINIVANTIKANADWFKDSLTPLIQWFSNQKPGKLIVRNKMKLTHFNKFVVYRRENRLPST